MAKERQKKKTKSVEREDRANNLSLRSFTHICEMSYRNRKRGEEKRMNVQYNQLKHLELYIIGAHYINEYFIWLWREENKWTVSFFINFGFRK
jgi:hypothetical protein